MLALKQGWLMKRISLPIDTILSDVTQSLEKIPNLVLQASPGSGKTTRIPPALLSASFRGEKKEILVLEPRRLAAKYAARRVADELGEEAGKTVGYQFRFENVSSSETRLRFLTEGMLMRRLLGDPELRNVAAVLLDEFHERHLHTDVALGYLRWLQKEKRPDLRILIMSATLEADMISAYLGNCPILKVDARPFPVTTEHLPAPPAKHLDQTVKEAVLKALNENHDGGDILVFLPGMGEIRRCADALSSLASRNMMILPLHGELSREEQDRAMKRADRTKIILATNVAETSLTIEGVTTVIDSGLHRQASYSWWSGVPALKTRAISRASAIQRAGRAGRTAPGRCLRLYTQGDFSSRTPFDTPEIQRADIAQTLLELKALGVARLGDFPWFERPSDQAIESALTLLYRLGALDGPGPESRLTDLGKRMVELPAHPRLGRMLIEAEKRGVLEEAATLASLIHEGRLESLDALEGLERRERDESLRRTRMQFLSAFRSLPSPGKHGSSQRNLSFSVLCGFPDRVAKKRRRGQDLELLFSFGGSSKAEESGVLSESDYFVVLEIQEQQHLGQARAHSRVRSVCAIEADWLLDLEPSSIQEREDLEWDSERQRVQSFSRMTYDALVLTESRGEPSSPERATEILLKNILSLDPERISTLSALDWVAVLGKIADPELIEQSLARVAFFAKHTQGMPSPEGPELWRNTRRVFDGKLSRKEVDAIDWANELIYALLPDHASVLDQKVPSFVQLPSGRKAKIQYRLSQAPWVESRLQDFFGMKTGPALLDGRIALTLHLLAPNMRAVQVTTDLAGFWQRGYPELRHALSRRYPRHQWPEDPYRPEPKS